MFHPFSLVINQKIQFPLYLPRNRHTSTFKSLIIAREQLQSFYARRKTYNIEIILSKGENIKREIADKLDIPSVNLGHKGVQKAPSHDPYVEILECEHKLKEIWRQSGTCDI